MTVAAHISLHAAVQEKTDGVFPAITVYPADYDERIGSEGTKVFAATGAVEAGEEGTTLDVTGKLTEITRIVVQNLASFDEEGDADVVLTGGPLPGTVTRGDIGIKTNAIAGWPAENIVVTGTAGTPYKVICLGR
jgi:hypothetical protein